MSDPISSEVATAPEEVRAYVVTLSRKVLVHATSAKEARREAGERRDAGAYACDSKVTKVRRDPYGWLPPSLREHFVAAKFNTVLHGFFDADGQRFLTNGHMAVSIGDAASSINACGGKRVESGASLVESCKAALARPKDAKIADVGTAHACGGEWPIYTIGGVKFAARYVDLVERLWTTEWHRSDGDYNVVGFNNGQVIAIVMGMRQ